MRTKGIWVYMDNNNMNNENYKKIYGLIGYPLGHSFSHTFFKEKFLKEGIDAKYINFEIDKIDDVMSVVRANPNLQGFNVTVPYKESIIDYLADLDREAREIGAVNVVKIDQSGRMNGYNSDVFGFVESVRPMLSRLEERNALILGVGGASKAVMYGLKNLGFKVSTVSRRIGVGDFTYDTLNPEIIRSNSMIVNTTPLGMFPDVNSAPDIPYEAIDSRHLCYDVVYNPVETLFMKFCASKGANVCNGLEMLRLQAEKAWEIWNE